MSTQPKCVIMHADGACRGNPGLGGWGYRMMVRDRENNWHVKTDCGFGGEKVTNNAMELVAVIQGLMALTNNSRPVKVYSDSKYVVNGINSWMADWKLRNWKNASNKPVANAQLWQQLDSLMQHHKVYAFHVSGHSGDEGNDIADELANKGIDDWLMAQQHVAEEV